MKNASEAPFPYGWPKSVCYFVCDILGVPEQLPRYRAEFRAAVQNCIDSEIPIYAVWPGQYRSDLFVIDKPELLADAIGLVHA